MAVREEVERMMGPGASVRRTRENIVFEVKNLDGLSDEEEVAGAVANATGVAPEELRVRIRKSFGGNQTATVVAPVEATRALLTVGRLRVGLVYCRVVPTDQRMRCFKCLSFGHAAKECDGPDRSKCCRLCGSEGHFAVKCTAAISVRVDFKKLIEEGDVARRTLHRNPRNGPLPTD